MPACLQSITRQIYSDFSFFLFVVNVSQQPVAASRRDVRCYAFSAFMVSTCRKGSLTNTLNKHTLDLFEVKLIEAQELLEGEDK